MDPVQQWAADEVAGLTPAKAPKGITEADIAAKIKAAGGAGGLSREQAIEVLTNQAAHDAQQPKNSAGKSGGKTKTAPTDRLCCRLF